MPLWVLFVFSQRRTEAIFQRLSPRTFQDDLKTVQTSQPCDRRYGRPDQFHGLIFKSENQFSKLSRFFHDQSAVLSGENDVCHCYVRRKLQDSSKTDFLFIEFLETLFHG